jgi:hypothetical protein
MPKNIVPSDRNGMGSELQNQQQNQGRWAPQYGASAPVQPQQRQVQPPMTEQQRLASQIPHVAPETEESKFRGNLGLWFALSWVMIGGGVITFIVACVNLTSKHSDYNSLLGRSFSTETVNRDMVALLICATLLFCTGLILMFAQFAVRHFWKRSLHNEN